MAFFGRDYLICLTYVLHYHTTNYYAHGWIGVGAWIFISIPKPSEPVIQNAGSRVAARKKFVCRWAQVYFGLILN